MECRFVDVASFSDDEGSPEVTGVVWQHSGPTVPENLEVQAADVLHSLETT